LSKLAIDDDLIQCLVGEIAPLVEQHTGWSLRLDGMVCRVLPRRRGYEEILLGRLRGLGVDIDENTPRGLVERLIEFMIEASVLAAYQPHSQELLVVRENVDDSNLDGLRVVLAHELVHRGQHVHHPDLFHQVEVKYRGLVKTFFSEHNLLNAKQVSQTLQEIQPTMALLESHASYVQQEIQKGYFPQARIEKTRGLPVLLLRLFAGQKLAQYSEGLSSVSQAIANGSLEAHYRATVEKHAG
jgi:hypothetical protein